MTTGWSGEDHIVARGRYPACPCEAVLHRRHQHPRRAGSDTGRHRRCPGRRRRRSRPCTSRPACSSAGSAPARSSGERSSPRPVAASRRCRHDRPATSSSTSRAIRSSSPHAASSICSGSLLVDGPEPRYQPFWAHDRDGERRAFESLVDSSMRGSRQQPDLHVYHFGGTSRGPQATDGRARSPAKPRSTTCSAGRCSSISHGPASGPARGVPSYSLKDVEALFGFIRSGPVQSGTEAILHYERWMRRARPDAAGRDRGLQREDCRATLACSSGCIRSGPPDLPWPEPPEAQPLSAEAARPSMRGATAPGARRGRRSPGHPWLAGELLEYHRREARPQWWAYFDRLAMSPEELVEDREAIGDLRSIAARRPAGQAFARSYRSHFPLQDHKLRPGLQVHRSRDRQARRGDRRASTIERHRRHPASAAGPEGRRESAAGGARPGRPVRDRLQRGRPARRASRSAPAMGATRPSGHPRAGTAQHPRARSGREDPDDRPRRDEGARPRARRQLPVHPGAARLRQDVDRRAHRRRTCCERATRRRRGPEPQGDPQPARRDRERGARRRACASAG